LNALGRGGPAAVGRALNPRIGPRRRELTGGKNQGALSYPTSGKTRSAALMPVADVESTGKGGRR